jgi:hypothetical protein
MAAELARLFPKGLKHEEAERREQRHPPPFRFVPDKIKEKEEGDENLLKLISVELAPSSTMKVVPHSFTNVENFLLYQGQHDYILSQQEAKPKWITLSLVLNDTEIKVAALTLLSADVITTKEKKSLERLKETQDSIALKMNAIIVKAFNLYQQMSSPALRVEWDDIVDEICFTKDWLNDEGVKSPVERGQTWATLTKCKRAHLLTVCDEDAAERWYTYRTVTIKKPFRLSIKPFWKRVKELDDKAPNLPCLKDTANCPMDVTRANVSMTGFEMCTLLMRVISHEIADEYDCLHDSVPTDPKKLVKELTKIETKLKSSSKSATDSRNRSQPGAPTETGTQKEKRPRKGGGPGMAQPIPRKVLKPPRKDTGMLCALCDKYGGAAKSHTTPHCKRWTGAGKDHPEWRGRTAKNLNVHGQEDDIKSLMAQQLEFNASIMKSVNKLSKKKKRKSKRSSRYSSSDSSDSD